MLFPAPAQPYLESLWMAFRYYFGGKYGVSRAASVCFLAQEFPTDANSPEQYVEIAINLARDLPRLAKLRHDLRERMKCSR